MWSKVSEKREKIELCDDDGWRDRRSDAGSKSFLKNDNRKQMKTFMCGTFSFLSFIVIKSFHNGP